MSKIKLFDLSGKVQEEIELNQKLLVSEVHKQAIFDAILAENLSQIQGTHSTLKKGEVSGGGKKPYEQKHTGRARQGSIRNPHYVGGGIAFGPKPNRNYKIKVNKKVSSLAFKSAITSKVNNNELLGLVDSIKQDKPSTKAIVKLLKELKVNKKVLIVAFEKNENLEKSSANLPNVSYKLWNQVSVKDLIDANCVLAQKSAINNWVERLN
ncbi:50S ribosomal protein L4 [Mycoplasma tullyi]|uniref:Large ribosomal subunit protein uL4 n=1 Tax=Mycoplasma tullyi TaxID=1612150 RepID=A0A7D7Y6F0_9MOLU|nr:50S ribosomal protein L4 [Mycoplasma tullyi]QMT98576.1 50S ribosomal protein L4 [Mycoplasma tullyi]